MAAAAAKFLTMDHNIDTHPAKKMKLQDEEIPKSQHAAKKMKLQDEEIPKSQHGTNAVNFEGPQPRVKYYVLVDLKVTTHLQSSRESSRERRMSFFCKMMKDAGCSESQIIEEGCSSYCFFADLTPEEAKKLSDLDSVRNVKPYKSVFYVCDSRIRIPAQ